jgi:hypothetical protein
MAIRLPNRGQSDHAARETLRSEFATELALIGAGFSRAISVGLNERHYPSGSVAKLPNSCSLTLALGIGPDVAAPAQR